jgi:hypothetical protein
MCIVRAMDKELAKLIAWVEQILREKNRGRDS